MLLAINIVINGWYGYFKFVHSSIFRQIDEFIRRRLRAMLLRRNKSRGFGKSYGVHCKWPNAFFRKLWYKSLEIMRKNERQNHLFPLYRG
ncbi:MAG: hypothetical protein LBU12_08195 [Deltaproteobacteria bacterium]|nr:hypothetical protein [Deltaproteobacteria bacterium]